MKYFSAALGAAVLFSAGCAGTKPLVSVAPDSRARVRFANESKPHNASFSTITQRNGEKLISDGLLGGAIGVTLIAGSEGDKKGIVSRIRSDVGNFETDLINERFEVKLLAAGLRVSNDASASTLELKVSRFGLREVQRGFFAPYAFADAKLRTTDGKQIWWACAQSVGTKQRRDEEFGQRPELYREDFVEVADDLSRQLIEGPIRVIER
jgi:hypothetical protein